MCYEAIVYDFWHSCDHPVSLLPAVADCRWPTDWPVFLGRLGWRDVLVGLLGQCFSFAPLRVEQRLSALVHHFTRNHAGRDLVVGDIHGAFSRLQTALDRIKFNPVRDRLFCVGNLVDRGPESELYAEWLARPWFHSVQGNHEAMAIGYAAGELSRDLYHQNGGAWNIVRTPEQRDATAAAFAALPLVIEIETSRGVVGVVHADVPFKSWPDLVACLEHEQDQPLFKHVQAYLQWSRERLKAMDETGVHDVRAVIAGHVVLDAPLTLGNVMYIETGGWRGVPGGIRDFTIIDTETLQPV